MIDDDSAASLPRDSRPLPFFRRFLQAFLVILIVGGGVGLMLFHKSFKKAPERRAVKPGVRKVKVLALKAADVPVKVTGYGTVRAKYTIQIIPQVGGKVTSVSSLFKAGHRVAKGTTLFEIEQDDYRNTLNRAEAEESRLKAQVRLLEENLKHDRKRLEVSRKSRDLARKEYIRVRDLLRKDRVGSESVVEAAERLYLDREREIIALENSIAAQPIRVSELQAALTGARAQKARARLDLARTRITAPFDARVEAAHVQVGQVVNPTPGGGTGLAVLTDLGSLEIPVALDNTDLEWLPITNVTEEGEYTFDPAAAVTLCWTGDPDRYSWKGRIARLERFEAATRTITLVIEVTENTPAIPSRDRLQLEEGMFCRVTVDGILARGVYSVPRGLVRQDRTLPLLVDGKLDIRPVRVRRFQGDMALVNEGLHPGDSLVLTPLINPVPGMALAVEKTGGDHP